MRTYVQVYERNARRRLSRRSGPQSRSRLGSRARPRGRSPSSTPSAVAAGSWSEAAAPPTTTPRSSSTSAGRAQWPHALPRMQRGRHSPRRHWLEGRPLCASSRRRRVAVLVPWLCYRGRCAHAKSLEAETKERARLSALANDFLSDAEPGATVSAQKTFSHWLRHDARHATVEAATPFSRSALEGYRHVCRELRRRGRRDAARSAARKSRSSTGYRCSHCNGEGTLEPPRLASLEDAMPIAAE